MQSGEVPGLAATPEGQAGERRVARDLFPLPGVRFSPRPLGLFSRRSQQRIGRRRHFEEEVDRTVVSLNQMYGRPRAKATTVKPVEDLSAGQRQVLEFIEQANRRVGDMPSLTGPEALEELRVSEGYADLPTASPLGSFVPELVSLPEVGGQPVPLAKLWGERGQQEVEDFFHSQTLGAAEAEEQKRCLGLTRTYEDPKFREPGKYAAFVRRLYDLHLVDVSLQAPEEFVTIFFVKKKGNKLRMILDCRLANTHFREPEGIQLASADSLSKMELPEDTPLYMASADLQNAFYTMGMPEQLRTYFGLRKLRASDLGLEQVDGVKVKPSQWVFPRVAVIPMGWSHAMWWCQRLSEKLAEDSGLTAKERLRDFDPIPDGQFWHVEYVDNLVVFGTDKAQVKRRFLKAVETMRDAGLTVHEIEYNEGDSKVLGWSIDGSGRVGPTLARLWRIRVGIRELLHRGWASGQQLERLVGHMTFVSLCRRESLSILGDTYTYIKRHYSKAAPLWKSVRRELACWDGLAPLIFVNMTSPWDTTIYAVDASEWGMGVTTGKVSAMLAKQLGRHVERWRFKDKQANNPRAFVQASDQVYECNALDGELGFAKAVSSGGSKNFQTVPFDVVDRQWRVVGRHRWLREESMPVYEARASQYAIRHALRNTSNFGRRFIILTDSMTAAVSFDKGRANSFRLRRVLQQTCALALATGTFFRSRWVPSEWNPADRPSRGGWLPSCPVRRFWEDDSPDVRNSNDMGSIHEEEERTKLSSKVCPNNTKQHGSAPDLGHRAQPGNGSDKTEVAGEAKTEEERTGAEQNPHEGLSGSEDFEGLRQALECAEAVEQTEHLIRHEFQANGQCSDSIPGVPARARHGSQCGKLCDSSSDFQHAGLQGFSFNAKESDVHEGVATFVPSTCQDASAIRVRVPDGNQSSGAKAAGSCSGPSVELCPVPSAIGAASAKGAGHCSTHQEGQGELPALCSAVASHGSGNTIKDKTVGRNDHPRSAAASVSGACYGKGAQAGQAAQGRVGFSGHHDRGGHLHGAKLERPGARSNGGAKPLQTASWGGILRKPSQVARNDSHPSPRPMAKCQKPEKLRERRQATAAFWKPAKKSATSKRRRGKKGQQALPQAALSPAASLTFAVFLEIFCGCGRLGRRVAAQCHWPVLLWDISLGEQYDLTKRANQQKIIHWMQHGLVRAGHLGTPCNSFSRARDRPGGPPPLRSDMEPMGKQFLRAADAAKVRIGNILLYFSCRVLGLALQLHLPFTLENPQRSRLWITPPILRLLRKQHCSYVDVHFCMFGTPWKKPTRVLGCHLNLDGLQAFVCSSTKRGICAKTGKTHVPLVGQNVDGQWLTKIAEPYPWKFATALAKAFYNTELATIAAEFARHLDLPRR